MANFLTVNVQETFFQSFMKDVLTDLNFIRPHYHLCGFYWGHQCSRTLSTAISMEGLQSYRIHVSTEV